MRVIVTGGSGFIGSRLVKALSASGPQVAVVDLVPRRAPEIIEHAASVLNAAAMVDVVTDADAVVHLAGYVRDAFRRDPCGATTLQVQGTLNVLEACRRNRVPYLLLASSFYVY